ncbi:ABC transporter ATP-binding protein [Terribacillus saccharophilus]|uniref:ABC transporter ATP-binding protein n=1 Tax=Terribacillus saccharophilus TaxID=361277 RepID=A0A268AGA5_9BACI|nr:ABC transporter ATP-binding protein [Terribacillus saccharophilus]PAD23138.1 ABC transporter ATP-binding protein [Terribacillus saccharophilus]
MNIIETKNLTKVYKSFTAVNQVNLHVKKGRIYGFLGPNGSGKTTTMKMLLGLIKQTSGSFHINGQTFPQNRESILRNIGSIIEAPSFYGNLTGRENLDIIRKILGLPKEAVEESLQIVGLEEFGDRLAKKYSLGMKQRLGIASALIGSPPILVLDEPTNGLDPVGTHEIRNLIISLPEKTNCTVIISSHLLSEMQLMAQDIGILNKGRMLFEGSMEELIIKAKKEGYGSEHLEDMFLGMIQQDNHYGRDESYGNVFSKH